MSSVEYEIFRQSEAILRLLCLLLEALLSLPDRLHMSHILNFLLLLMEPGLEVLHCDPLGVLSFLFHGYTLLGLLLHGLHVLLLVQVQLD